MKSLVVYIYNDKIYKLNNTADNIEVKTNKDNFTIKFRHRAPGGGLSTVASGGAAELAGATELAAAISSSTSRRAISGPDSSGIQKC